MTRVLNVFPHHEHPDGGDPGLVSHQPGATSTLTSLGMILSTTA